MNPENMGDEMADAAAKMAATLAERPASLDPRALFLAMSRTLDLVKDAAGQLRQDWLDLDDSREDDVRCAARLAGVMESLSAASGMFEEIANGWL